MHVNDKEPENQEERTTIKKERTRHETENFLKGEDGNQRREAIGTKLLIFVKDRDKKGAQKADHFREWFCCACP